MSNHIPCPAHPGQSYDESTGDCSCGSNHRRWASLNNPDGQPIPAMKLDRLAAWLLAMPPNVRLTEDEFHARFEPLDNAEGSWVFEWREMRDTIAGLGDQPEKRHDDTIEPHLWTFVDTDDGDYLVDGLHIVNAWGWAIAAHPRDADTTYEVRLDGPDEEEENEDDIHPEHA